MRISSTHSGTTQSGTINAWRTPSRPLWAAVLSVASGRASQVRAWARRGLAVRSRTDSSQEGRPGKRREQKARVPDWCRVPGADSCDPQESKPVPSSANSNPDAHPRDHPQVASALGEAAKPSSRRKRIESRRIATVCYLFFLWRLARIRFLRLCLFIFRFRVFRPQGT
jgi:hypothetical protein